MVHVQTSVPPQPSVLWQTFQHLSVFERFQEGRTCSHFKYVSAAHPVPPPNRYQLLICSASAVSSMCSRISLSNDYPPVGPSSSHTVGPMRAGRIFIADLQELNLLHKVQNFTSSGAPHMPTISSPGEKCEDHSVCEFHPCVFATQLPFNRYGSLAATGWSRPVSELPFY